MKKLLSCLLMVSMLVVPTKLTFAEEERTIDSFFPVDLYEDHWAHETLVDFVDAGILKGSTVNEDVYIYPNKHITRAEVAALLVRTLELTDDGTGKSFSDVPNNWMAPYIKAANANGILLGNGEKALPNDPIKRDELAAMIVRAFEATVDFENGTAIVFPDVKTNYWGTEPINKASKVGIIVGDQGKFSPNKNATRAEMVTMLSRALNLEVSNLTSDEDLISRLLEAENVGYQLLEKGNYEALFAHNKKYYTGYHLALANEMANSLVIMEDEFGVELSISLTEQLQAEVLSKSDRFAVLAMTAGEAEYTLLMDTLKVTDQQSVEGTFYMRKINGDWYIYYSDVEVEF